MAILDEWTISYLGLRLTFPLLTKLGCRFTPSDITEEDLMEILLDDRAFAADGLRTYRGIQPAVPYE